MTVCCQNLTLRVFSIRALSILAGALFKKLYFFSFFENASYVATIHRSRLYQFSTCSSTKCLQVAKQNWHKTYSTGTSWPTSPLVKTLSAGSHISAFAFVNPPCKTQPPTPQFLIGSDPHSTCLQTSCIHLGINSRKKWDVLANTYSITSLYNKIAPH